MNGFAGTPTTIPQKKKLSGSPCESLSQDEERDELDEHYSPESTNLAPSANTGNTPGVSRSVVGTPSSSGPDEATPLGRQNEYKTGTAICETCGAGIPIRDGKNRSFNLQKWNEHKSSCSSAAVPPREPAGPVVLKSASPGLSPVVSQSGPPPERKKRRAKRSEEERIDFFRTDPNVAQFEPYRVLCACCNKWIRLRSNSSYCSIPWEAHRKSCLAKKSTQSEALQGMITTYPQFRYRDRDQIFCDCCESWVVVGEQDTSQATSQWNKHKASCQKTSSASHSHSGSGHMPTGPSSTSDIALLRPKESKLPSIALSYDNEVRRRNAEQRASTLKEDPLASKIEPYRVLCSLCRKWVQLRKDIPYCSYPWVQHKSKCILRYEKQNDVNRMATVSPASSSNDRPREKRRKLEHTPSDADTDDDINPSGHANMIDLLSNEGRKIFICKSVEYLFRTTYSPGDEITIASLVAYLNSALPPDKYEDFDTIEVTHAAADPLLRATGFLFEGDTLLLAN